MTDELNNTDGADGELHDRLAELGRNPVDTSGIECRLDAAMRGESTAPRRRNLTRGWYALAASVLLGSVVVFLAILLSPSTGPRVITAQEIVAIHGHYREHGESHTAATSVAGANAALAGQWADAPTLPEVSGFTVAECCLYHLPDCQVACLHLKTVEGSDVTVVVGRGRELRGPSGDPFETGGQVFTSHQVGTYHVLTTQSADRFVALVAEIPLIDLQRIASSMKL